MAGPWEQYQQPQQAQGPWEQYQQPQQAQGPWSQYAAAPEGPPAPKPPVAVGLTRSWNEYPGGPKAQPVALGAREMPIITSVGLGDAALNALPRAGRAALNFERVMQGARETPINPTEAFGLAQRANELASHGTTAPKVVGDFLKRAGPELPPVTYPVGRDFAMNAGRLSQGETLAANPPMQRQVAMLAKALDTANEGAAESAGLGNEYRAAMKEYRQAQQLKTAGKAAGKAAIGALGIGGLYELARKALGVR